MRLDVKLLSTLLLDRFSNEFGSIWGSDFGSFSGFGAPNLNKIRPWSRSRSQEAFWIEFWMNFGRFWGQLLLILGAFFMFHGLLRDVFGGFFSSIKTAFLTSQSVGGPRRTHPCKSVGDQNSCI